MPRVAGAATETMPAPSPNPAEEPTAASSTIVARRQAAPFTALAAFLGGLMLYGATAAPGVQGGDSGEFQFVGYILGIPHPPGYPLYALVSKLWTLVFPFGEVAGRMNLLSAMFAAAALGATAWAGCRSFGDRPGTIPSRRLSPWERARVRASPGTGRGEPATVGLVAASWLAVAPTWWGQATIASVRPPTGFFLATVLAGLATYAVTRRSSVLYLTAGLYGFGLTHHISLYTLAPAVVLFVLVVDPAVLRRPSTIVRALLAGGLPLLVYLYLPIRSALGTPFDASHPTTLRAFADLVSARGFAGDMLFFDPLSPARLELGRQILLTNFGTVGVLLACLGALATLATRPRWFLLTGGIALINLCISLSYRAPVIADYLIPTYLVMALWIGSLALLFRRAAPIAAVVLVAPAALYAVDNWSGFDLSHDTADERFLRDSFALVAPTSTILTDWYHATVLQYGQYGRGERPDVTVEYVAPRGPEVPWLEAARTALDRGPVYATGLDQKLGSQLHLQRLGPLYQVLAEPSSAVPPGLSPSGLRFADAIELVGYRLEAPPRDADIAITLVWQALQPLGRDVSQFVHVVDPSGKVWGQRDGAPGEGLYPTSRWRSGELVVEQYAFAVSPTAPKGELEVEVGWYESLPAGGWKRFEARAADGTPAGDAPRIARVQLPTRNAGGDTGWSRWLENEARARFPWAVGDREPGVWRRSAFRSSVRPVPFGHAIVLTGWGFDHVEARPGETIRVALDFLPRATIPDDDAAFVHLVDGGGAMKAQKDSVPVDGGLPTLRWAPGRPVRDVRALPLPADLPPGEYKLRTGIYVMSTGAHLPVLDDALARAGQGDFVELGILRVLP
jgi:hypothetical protein